MSFKVHVEHIATTTKKKGGEKIEILMKFLEHFQLRMSIIVYVV